MLHQTPTTIPSEVRDSPDWHRGRKSYAVWALRCDGNEAINGKFLAARAHLDGYLLDHYHRQPHITVRACGFLGDENQYDDDFTRTQLQDQVQALGKSDIRPFEIEIGDLNSFASAPFLEVHDPLGGIAHLREVLSQGGCEFLTAPYRPHLTIGLYADKYPSKGVMARMAAFSNRPVRWRAEQITFATYNADMVGGNSATDTIFASNIKRLKRSRPTPQLGAHPSMGELPEPQVTPVVEDSEGPQALPRVYGK